MLVARPTFGGVGTGLRVRDGVASFASVLPDRPLARAGGRDGDVIVAIDGRSVAGLTRDELIPLVRGEPGTTVSFELRRDGAPLVLEVRRALMNE